MTDTYTRQPLNSRNRSYKRWLVIVDIMPNVGAIDGYKTIVLPRRTLNVVGKHTLADALGVIHGAAREMHYLSLTNSWQSGFRYGFCLIDLNTQQTVSIDQIHTWADTDSLESRQGDTPQNTHADLMRAVVIANSLSGRSAPMPVLLDNTDPLLILRQRRLLPLNDTPTPVVDSGLGIFHGAVTNTQLQDSLARATERGDSVWLQNLHNLPAIIDSSVECAVSERAKQIVEALLLNGIPESSPRVATVRIILERAVARFSTPLYQSIYRTIITQDVNYIDPDLLSGVVQGHFAGIIDTLPQFMHDALTRNLTDITFPASVDA